MHNLSKLFLAITSLGLSAQGFASDFSLPFVNSSGLGVAYSDWAVGHDASTAYTNPAGLVNLKTRQMVVNALGIFGDAKYTGSAMTPSFPFPAPVIENGTARSPIGNFSPSFYYSLPLSDRFTGGFNVTTPFGLGTNYPNSSVVRYAATRSQVAAMDISPSLGLKLNDFVSAGVGFDAIYLAFQLNNMYGPPLSQVGPTSFIDQTLENKLKGWGYGWHGGLLFNFTQKTHVGVSYNSHVSIVTKGNSILFLPSNLAVRSDLQYTKAALPARLQISLEQGLTDRLNATFTAFYVNWSTFSHITMTTTVAPTPAGYVTLPVTIPFNYSNCWDFALGATFKASEKILLRAGVELMDTPSNNIDRGVADPIGNATVVTIGAHYKASDALSYDIGIGHSFFKEMPVNFANQLTVLQGTTKTQTTVIGGQVNWSIA
ncbi:MAG: aromatic hydrocarbon degradation protein [Legionella sp.]|nr:MAG: aromatic hydrocarbon degradation protein [Legionella sp.]